MNRCAVRIGSVLALAAGNFFAAPVAASAAPVSYVFDGRTVTFTQIVDRPAGPAISIDDPALSQLLDRLGATVDWQRGSPYILLTTAKPIVVTFKIGQIDYKIADETRHGSFAPFISGIHAYVALADVLGALNLPAVQVDTVSAVATEQPEATPSASPSATIAPSPGATIPPSPGAAVQPSPSPSPTPGIADVTGVEARSQGQTYTVHVTVRGSTAYEWHRLRPPDNRWWLDLQNARLRIPAAAEPGAGPVTELRTHQDNPLTVRIALSLKAFDQVDVRSSSDGLDIIVSNQLASLDIERSGTGAIGNAVAARTESNAYHASNPRLIVIDPGHGGSDPGRVTGSIQEKTLALDMSERVKHILISRGWQVKMTRETDVDVYGPNASASDELQARDDVANKNGARIFVSIHVNAFMNAGPHGSTTYYYKPSDFPLAQAINRSIGSEIDIKDDGVVKAKDYVIHHADMPAALVETAFLSNPDDTQLLIDASWRQKMAQAIADGIVAYLNGSP